MNFEYTDKVKDLQERVSAFMDEHIYPNEETYAAQIDEGDRWQAPAILDELKAKARAADLWNLFLPESELGAGLTNLEYAPLCELMGRVIRVSRQEEISTARAADRIAEERLASVQAIKTFYRGR